MEELKRTRSRWGLLAVQSVIGAVILLLALVVRLVGGDLYDQLHNAFRTAMRQDVLTEALVPEEKQGQGGEDLTVGAASLLVPPAGATFSPLTLPCPPTAIIRQGKVTSEFGYRENPLGGGVGFHTGVDVAASKGTLLYAPYDGTVIASAWDDSYGNYITIVCGEDLQIRFAHCSALLCHVGDEVKAGDAVAKVGNTGNSTGPHVHVMAMRGGVAYNPALLIPEECYA